LLIGGGGAVADGAVTEAKLADEAVSGAKLKTSDAAALRTALGLGDAATRSTGIGGTQVVLGNDTRLSDARTPTPHTHTLSEVTDAVERTTYTFASSTGVTLTNRNGTAAVTGGQLLLSTAARADHYTSTVNAPEGRVSVLHADGRAPTRVRARVRLAALTVAGTTSSHLFPHLELITADATPQRYTLVVGGTGWAHFRRNDSGPVIAPNDVATGVLSAAIAAGTLVLEVEAVGGVATGRVSTDGGSTWTPLGQVRLPDPIGYWSGAACGFSCDDAGISGTSSAAFDDLVVERWP